MVYKMTTQEISTKADEARILISRLLDASQSACFTNSFQAEDMVVLHLLRERRPDIPVLFLETGYHFADVYQYRDEMTERYKLNLVNLQKESVAEHEKKHGELFRTQPDQCCKLRKVAPLFEALEGYDTWFTGLRRVQSLTRANLQIEDEFPLPSGKHILKVSPLAHWSDREVWAFAKEHQIPLLPLYNRGYTSIGCEPCTALPGDPNNLRSGRWAGAGKIECGIHIAEEH
jgi:phosphoadenosine phosphosulfate reductase